MRIKKSESVENPYISFRMCDEDGDWHEQTLEDHIKRLTPEYLEDIIYNGLKDYKNKENTNEL